MAINLKDIDPAVIQSKDEKVKQAPPPPAPKKEIIVNTRVITANSVAEGSEEQPPKFIVDHAAFCLVSTIDSKILAMPRAVAAKVPGVGPILVDQAADDHSPIPIDINASGAIAVAHWVEHVGSAAGKSETAMPETCLYTEMSSLLHTEWERDFESRILLHDSETLLRVTNFAERNGMAGLLDFCVIALSCSIRGKSNHEMMVALCCDGEEHTAEDIENGKRAYPWVNDLTKPHGDE